MENAIIEYTMQWLHWNSLLTELFRFEERLEELESICDLQANNQEGAQGVEVSTNMMEGSH